MADEENDEILREIDMYVTSNKSCSILQFPLRPVYSETPSIESCRFKPVNRKIRFNIANSGISQLHTSTSVCSNSNICVGVIRNGALHISPINDVYQMRPCFDDVKFNDDEGVDVTQTSTGSSEDKFTSMQQVHVKPKESERVRASKELSYSHMKKKEDDEQFRRLNYFGMNSDESGEYFEGMYYEEPELQA